MGYYKIAFGKLEEGVNLDERIKNIMQISLLQTKDKKELEQEYANGRPIVFNVIQKGNYIFLYIAIKKGGKKGDRLGQL